MFYLLYHQLVWSKWLRQPDSPLTSDCLVISYNHARFCKLLEWRGLHCVSADITSNVVGMESGCREFRIIWRFILFYVPHDANDTTPEAYFIGPVVVVKGADRGLEHMDAKLINSGNSKYIAKPNAFGTRDPRSHRHNNIYFNSSNFSR